MSQTVRWHDMDLAIDPLDFDMSEWELVEQRTGLSGFDEFVEAIKSNKPAAWKAVYWIAVRRHQPDLAYSDFSGPTYADVMSPEAQDALAAGADRMIALTQGKAPATDGLVPSPTRSASTRKRSTASRSRISNGTAAT